MDAQRNPRLAFIKEHEMSVRRRMERDPETGAQYEVWLVDVVFQYPDGRRTRVKKKSPVQTRR